MPPKKTKKKAKAKGKDKGGEAQLRVVRCYKPVATAVAAQEASDRILEAASASPDMLAPPRDERSTIYTHFPQGQRDAHGGTTLTILPEDAARLGQRAHDALLKQFAALDLPSGASVSMTNADEATASAAIALGLVQEPSPAQPTLRAIPNGEPVVKTGTEDATDSKEAEEGDQSAASADSVATPAYVAPVAVSFAAAVVRTATGGLEVPEDVKQAHDELAKAASGDDADASGASGAKGGSSSKAGGSKKKAGASGKASRKGSVVDADAAAAAAATAVAFGLRGDCLGSAIPSVIDGAVTVPASLEAALGADHPLVACMTRFCEGLSILQACPGSTSWRPWQCVHAIPLTEEEQEEAEAIKAAATSDDSQDRQAPLLSGPARWEVALSRRGVERRVVVDSRSFPTLLVPVKAHPAASSEAEASTEAEASSEAAEEEVEDLSTPMMQIPLFPFASHTEGPELWPAVLFSAWCALECLGDEAPAPLAADAAEALVVTDAKVIASSPPVSDIPHWMRQATPLSVLQAVTGYRAVPVLVPESGLTATWKRILASCAPVNARTPAELLRDRALQYSGDVIRWRREMEVLVDRRRLRVQELVARAGFRPTSVLGMQRARELGVLAQAEKDAASDMPPPSPPPVPPLPTETDLLVLGRARLVLHAEATPPLDPVTAAGGVLVAGASYAVVACRRSKACRLSNGCTRPARATDAAADVVDEVIDWLRLAGPTSQVQHHERDLLSESKDADEADMQAEAVPAVHARRSGSRLSSSASSASGSAESHTSGGSEVAVTISLDPTDAEIWVSVSSLPSLFDLTSGASVLVLPPAAAVACSPLETMAPLQEAIEEGGAGSKKGGKGGKKEAAKKKDAKGGKGKASKKGAKGSAAGGGGGGGDADEDESGANAVSWCRTGETAVVRLRANDFETLSKALLIEPMPGAVSPEAPSPRLLVRSWCSSAGPSTVVVREISGSRKLMASTTTPESGPVYPWKSMSEEDDAAGDAGGSAVAANPSAMPQGVVEAAVLPAAMVCGSVLEIASDCSTGSGTAVVWRPALEGNSRLLAGLSSATDSIAAPEEIAASSTQPASDGDVIVEISMLSMGWRICVGRLSDVARAAGSSVALLRGASVPLKQTTLPGMFVPVVSSVVRVTEAEASNATLTWWLRGPAALISTARCFSIRLDTADVTAHLGAGGCVVLRSAVAASEAESASPIAGADALGTVDVALLALVPAPVAEAAWSMDIACSAAVSVSAAGDALPPSRTTSLFCGEAQPNRDGILFCGTVALPAEQVQACGGRARALAMTLMHATVGAAAEVPPALATLTGVPMLPTSQKADIIHSEGMVVDADADAGAADAGAADAGAADAGEDEMATLSAAVRESILGRSVFGMSGILIGSGEAVLEVRDATEDADLRAMCNTDRSGSALLVAVPAVSGINDEGAGDAALEAFEAQDGEVTAAALPSEVESGLEGDALTASMLLRGWKASSVWGEAQALLDSDRPDIGDESSSEDLTLRVILRMRAVPRGWRACPPYEAVAQHCFASPTETETAADAAADATPDTDTGAGGKAAESDKADTGEGGVGEITWDAKEEAELEAVELNLERNGQQPIPWRLAVVSHAGAVTAAAVSGPAVLKSSVLRAVWDSHSMVALRFTGDEEEDAAASSGGKKGGSSKKGGKAKASKKGAKGSAGAGGGDEDDASTDIGIQAVAELLPTIKPSPVQVRWQSQSEVHQDGKEQEGEATDGPLGPSTELVVGADAKLAIEALQRVLEA